MLRQIALFLLFGTLIFMFFSSSCWGEVEWSRQKTLKMDNTPIDMAVSADGKHTFVLTDVGKVFIYSTQGVLEETIDVGKTVSGIETSPAGDGLFLIDTKNNSIQILSLEFIKQINIAGSPFKGPADAPVVITIFSDFQ